MDNKRFVKLDLLNYKAGIILECYVMCVYYIQKRVWLDKKSLAWVVATDTLFMQAPKVTNIHCNPQLWVVPVQGFYLKPKNNFTDLFHDPDVQQALIPCPKMPR